MSKQKPKINHPETIGTDTSVQMSLCPVFFLQRGAYTDGMNSVCSVSKQGFS